MNSATHNLPPPADRQPLASAAARGLRPQFTDEPLVEQLYASTLALTTELAVTRERLDTLERLLAQHQLLPTSEIDNYRPDAAAAAARGRLQQGLLSRVWRALLRA